MADTGQLEQSLMADLSQADAARGAEAEAIGSSSPSAQAKNRITALRSTRGVLFQKELDDSNEAINHAAKMLGQEATQLDTLERAKFEAKIRKQLQDAQLRMIEQGGNFDKRLRERGIDQEKKYAFYRALGVATGSAASAGIQAAGSNPQQPQMETTKMDYTGGSPSGNGGSYA